MANEKNTFRQAVDLALQGNWPEARRILQRIVEQKTDDDHVWLWLADSYTSDEARLAILQYGLRRHPDSDHLMQALEQQLEKMNEAAAAELSREEQRMAYTETPEPEDEPPPDLRTPAGGLPLPQPEPQVPPVELSPDPAGEPQPAEPSPADFPFFESQPEAAGAEPIFHATEQISDELPPPETEPAAETDLLPAPETLQPAAAADHEGGRGLRPILITAAIILFIILLAYVYTRLR